ncbi:hypothetical protein OQX63_21330 [Pedobacter sp. PF22-3]|uniref:hypothetical protein n=1 Tax=Pedobacter sp. PF22-3 TaxID=2994467 RepID=UPI00224857F2|nr:hypothetical protein [Pedobacter sp. PF22-3]MCX2496053.1 hypothetical protein [Pedobacter sp. PF22-3]
MTLLQALQVWETMTLYGRLRVLLFGRYPGCARGGLCRAPLRSGTDEGSVLNPYNP